MRFHQFDVCDHHVGDELVELDDRLPAEAPLRLAGVTLKLLYLRRPVVLRVDLYSNDSEFVKNKTELIWKRDYKTMFFHLNEPRKELVTSYSNLTSTKIIFYHFAETVGLIFIIKLLKIYKL